MAKIKDPLLFSAAFKIDKAALQNMGVFNPVLNVDTRLFIDPLLLPHSAFTDFSAKAQKQYVAHFENIIKLLSKTKAEGDVAWRAAEALLEFRETKGTCLGYGAGSTNGRDLKASVRASLVKTAKEIIDIGIDDPELFSLLPLLQEGIGPDFISDFTTSIIEPQLIEFTAQIAKKLSVPLTRYEAKGQTYDCLINPTNHEPVLLVPGDILRHLPVASDWSEVIDAAEFNEKLRRRVNSFVSEIWRKKSAKDKKRLKKALLSDVGNLKEALSILKSIKPKAYNIKKDEKGFLVWHEWLVKAGVEFPLTLDKLTVDLPGIKKVVAAIIAQFKFLVEKHGLNKLLWHADRRVNEKVTQMLFFAVAYSYCKANNLDVNAEVDSGTGLIDFKFSVGFDKRIIVEIKHSSNQNLVTGYTRQLEIYKESEETAFGHYVVVNLGSMGKKMDQLEALENEKLSVIHLVDGNLRPSASKRK